MCGICGVISHSASTREQSIVRDMTDKLIHRGPDDKSVGHVDAYAFGHTRLSIIDVPGGAQPMTAHGGRFHLIFNGEIYNYRELRRELETHGEVFETDSDTEVLLRALVVHGVEILPKLVGMFAFAYYDREERRLILARDHFGIKPLYVAETANGLAFASEMKALLVHPDIKPKRSAQALQQYLAFQFCLGERTMFEKIKKLAPGSYMVWSNGSMQTSRYWSPVFSGDEVRSENEIVEELEALLRDSVDITLNADVPIGAYVSGGIDSSLVAMMASRNRPGLNLFHGRFDEAEIYDESRYAQQVADAAGAKLHICTGTPEDFVRLLPKISYMMDEPAAGPGVFAQFLVSEMASKQARVVLGGQGGDELFGGYVRYVVAYLEQALKGGILGTQEEGKQVVTLSSLIPNLAILRDYKPLLQKFWSNGLFDPMDMRYFSLIDRRDGITDSISPEILEEWSEEHLVEDFRKIFNDLDSVSYINKMTHFDMVTLLPALLQVEDRASMASSIEARVPLLDHRIVSLVGKVVPAMKFGGGQSKHLLRQVAQGILPASVSNRQDKRGFPVPINEWMASGVVREFVLDTLTSSAARNRGIFNIKSIEKCIQDQGRFGRSVWGMLSLELWHQSFSVE